MSNALLDRLNAALDERERLARAATPGPWHALDGGVTEDDHEQWPVADTDSKRNREDRVFIAANSPDHVLRTVAFHRYMVGHLARELADDPTQEVVQEMLELLAAAYLPDGVPRPPADRAE